MILSLIELTCPSIADLEVLASPCLLGLSSYLHTHEVVIKYTVKDARKVSTCENIIKLFFISFFIPEYLDQTI